MPFVRLIIVYIIVISAAVTFFNREAVFAMLGIAPVVSEQSSEVTMPETTASPAVDEPEQTPPNEAQYIPVATVEQLQTLPDAPAMQTPVAPQLPVESYETLLSNARQAFWAGDLEQAESIYKSLINRDAANIDIHGELGNLYYSQRKFGDAAGYYFIAGKLSAKSGNVPQVQAMLGVLQSIAPAKAAELRQIATTR